jgi:hypothetical protein
MPESLGKDFELAAQGYTSVAQKRETTMAECGSGPTPSTHLHDLVGVLD